MTKTGQELIESAAEALAFARGGNNDCVVHYPNEAIDTDAECPVIPVHDIENNEDLAICKKEAHRQFIEAAYARIKDIGTGRFVSSFSTVTNTGGYIELTRGR